MGRHSCLVLPLRRNLLENCNSFEKYPPTAKGQAPTHCVAMYRGSDPSLVLNAPQQAGIFNYSFESSRAYGPTAPSTRSSTV